MWLISPVKLTEYSRKFHHIGLDVYVDEEVSVKFWKSSGSGVRIRTLDTDLDLCEIRLGRGMHSLCALVVSLINLLPIPVANPLS